MPLQSSSGIKYSSNDDAYVVNHDLSFLFSSSSLDMNRSYSNFYVSSNGAAFSTQLTKPSPSFERKEVDFNVEGLAYADKNDVGDRTTLVLKAGDFSGSFLDIQHYSIATFGIDFSFALKNTGMSCGRNIYDATVPVSWELTFEGIANVLQEYRVSNLKVVGNRQPAIADLPSAFTLTDVGQKLTQILDAMREHGLIAI